MRGKEGREQRWIGIGRRDGKGGVGGRGKRHREKRKGRETGLKKKERAVF